MEGPALKGIAAWDVGQGGRRKRAKPRDHQRRAALFTVFQRHGPKIIRIIEMRRFDAAIEGDVLTQIKFLRDEIQIAQRIRLRGEMFCPFPFLK
jgi:hypothetical protein